MAAAPERADAPRLLMEAVRTGTADAEAFAAISDWILHEKEERVAAGLAEALASIDTRAQRLGGDERWDPTARAVLSVFANVLRAAQDNRKPDDVEAELSALMGIAAPAITAALRESPGSAELARFAGVFASLKPVSDDLVPLLAGGLRHAQKDVRIGAATALAALGRSAGAAVPALRAALKDADPQVSAAARDALRKIAPGDSSQDE
jgi:HEAT repeat protein